MPGARDPRQLPSRGARGWGVWTSSGFVISRVIPSEIQAQGGAMQAILIGLILVVTLLIRPRGLLGEELHVSRHAQF